MVAFPSTDQFVVLQLFGVDATGVPDASVHFSDSDTLGTEAMQVPHGVETHVTKTLPDTTQGTQG